MSSVEVSAAEGGAAVGAEGEAGGADGAARTNVTGDTTGEVMGGAGQT
jgi:hypothetical protein